jgi:hypothetical protein
MRAAQMDRAIELTPLKFLGESLSKLALQGTQFFGHAKSRL